ncbi:MAG: hypothetical protein HYU39_04945 [Thaumarchaeota archaeon]|nr:hypothetical protein [Nitrososphaerota archaeon]
MKIILHPPQKTPKKEFKVNKTFNTKSATTKRTIDISEAFGIGIDEQKTFTVYKNFTADINPGDITYITGDSGSGKSLLLKELSTAIQNLQEFRGIAPTTEPDPNEILIEGVGKDTGEAILTLSKTGLNEAFLMLRRYRDLSDGQKYRYRIAKAIDSGKGTWIFDEFCSVLDRTTAKVVAYTIQKAARKHNKTLIVATTHTDLFDELDPSVYIYKQFGNNAKIDYRQNNQLGKHSFSLLNEATIREGTKEEFQHLESFHYRGGLPAFTKKIYVAELRGEIIGGIIYSSPHLALTGRHLALPEYKIRPMKERLKKLNTDFLRISRVVILPKFRSIGLGVMLVKETVKKVHVPYVETLAVMAKYNPFFEKAGFRKIYDPLQEQSTLVRLLKKLGQLGLNTDLIRSKNANLQYLNRLNQKDLQAILDTLIAHNANAKRLSRAITLIEKAKKGDREALADALTRLPLPAVYLIWKNPAHQLKEHHDPHASGSQAAT